LLHDQGPWGRTWGRNRQAEERARQQKIKTLILGERTHGERKGGAPGAKRRDAPKKQPAAAPGGAPEVLDIHPTKSRRRWRGEGPF